MKIERMKLDDLICDEANIRIHDDRNINSIKESLKRFGQQQPLIIDAKNMIRAGNGRYRAMKEMGWDQCNVIRSNLLGDEAIAFAIADNRTAELAGWDLDALDLAIHDLVANGIDMQSIGFKEEELMQLLGPMKSVNESESNRIKESEYGEKIIIMVRDMPLRNEILKAIADLFDHEGWMDVTEIK